MTEILHKQRDGLNYLSTGCPDPPHILGWRPQQQQQRREGIKGAKPGCWSLPVRARAPSLHTRTKKVNPLGVSPAPCLRHPPAHKAPVSPGQTERILSMFDMISRVRRTAGEEGIGNTQDRGRGTHDGARKVAAIPDFEVPNPLPVSVWKLWWVESGRRSQRGGAGKTSKWLQVRNGSCRLGAVEIRERKPRSLPLRCFTCTQDNSALNLVRHPTSFLVLSFANPDSA